MYYYVPMENLETERNEPCSAYRLASDEGKGQRSADQEVAMCLWNQAIFIIAQLLTAGLLHINELDPIRRYLPSYNRPRRAGRYSAFQVRKRRNFICVMFYILSNF
jgi:phosphorylase kinase alpha/beta subunit